MKSKPDDLPRKKNGHRTVIEVVEGDRWFAALPAAGPKIPPAVGEEE